MQIEINFTYEDYLQNVSPDDRLWLLVMLVASHNDEQFDFGGKKAFLGSLQRLQDPEGFLHCPHSVFTDV